MKTAPNAARPVSIPAGGKTANLTINTSSNSAIKSNVTVSSGTGYNVGHPSSVSATVVDDTSLNLPVVTISSSGPISRLESDPTNLNFVLTRSGSNAAPLTVNVTVTGTAILGEDYLGLGNTSTQSITFSAGQSVKNIPIDPVDDTVGEQNEYVLVAVQPGTGYTVGGASSSAVYINNDDSVSGTTGPFVYRYLASTAATDPGIGKWNYNVVVNGVNLPTMIYISNYDVNNISQTAWLTAINQSTTTPKGIFTVVPGATLYPVLTYNVTGNITIGAAFSSIPIEPADTYTRNSTPSANLLVNFNTVAVAGPTGPTEVIGASKSPTGTTGTVVGTKEPTASTVSTGYTTTTGAPGGPTGPTDTLPTVSVTSPPIGVPELGPNILFTVSRTGSNTSALPVYFNISGSATPGVDYYMRPLPPVVTIPAGASSSYISASPIYDQQLEGPEVITITLNSSNTYVIGSGTASSVISNV